MSTGSTTTDEAELCERISLFVARNFPQIGMHGGSHAVGDIDVERGEVHISLGGACSGCGISPMTVQALKTRLVQAIPEISVVHADTGMADAGTPQGFDGDDVPF
ncbi:MAG: NifU family protein [Haloarculaceae archaeon]